MKERRLRLVDEAIDTFGTSLLNYARSLCKNNSVDAEALFDDVFIYALKKFPESKLTAFGYYRFKLFQLYVDRYRSERRRPDKPFEELPELPQVQARQPESDTDEAEFAKSFFSEYPVDLSNVQKEMLILWGRHGFTHEQIGKKLGIPRSSVADQIKIGRAAIVEYVNEQGFKNYE